MERGFMGMRTGCRAIRSIFQQFGYFGKLAGMAGLSLLLQMQAAAAAPSFDCAKAGNKVEKSICASDELSQLDMQMAKAYSDFRNSVSESDAVLLKQEQIRWVKKRNRCGSSKDCLQQAYQSRINGLELGVIRLSFSSQKLPVEINYGQGENLRIFDEINETSDKDFRNTSRKIFIQHNQEKPRLLVAVEEVFRLYDKSVESADYVDSVELVFDVSAHGVIPVLHMHDIPYVMSHMPPGQWSAYYMAPPAGQYQEVFRLQAGERSETTGVWQRNATNHQLQILLTEKQKDHTYGRVLSTTKLLKEFDFQHGVLIDREVAQFDQDLEPPVKQETVDRYLREMNEFLKVSSERRYPDDTRCHVLYEAREDFFSLYDRAGEKMSWDQFIYAASRLGGEAKQVHLSERMIFLAQEMLRYRNVIRQTPEWEARLQAMYSGSGYEIIENYSRHEGFPALNQCEHVFRPYGSMDAWAYGFWARRYMNEQFDVAGNILETGLKALGKAYQFDRDTLPPATTAMKKLSAWSVSSIVNRNYCGTVNGDGAVTRFALDGGRHVAGDYEIEHQTSPVLGHLTQCRIDEGKILICRWKDRGGVGNAYFIFDMDSKSFEGGYDYSEEAAEHLDRSEIDTGGWVGSLCP